MSKINNPILCGFNPDPCICKGLDKWYIAVSTFEWYPGVSIYESEDMVNWTLKINPLERSSQLNLVGEQPSGGIWAPSLTYADNKYWLVYTDNKLWKGETSLQPLRDMHDYLVTAPSIEGPWSEPIHLISDVYDPCLYHEDGRKWLVYTKRDFRGVYRDLITGIFIREYSDREGKLIGEEKLIYQGANIKHDFYISTQIYEGPYLMKRNGYYYLITAEGGPGYTHCNCVSRSRNLMGPYEFHPYTPMLTSMNSNSSIQKAGHGNMVEGPNGEWYMTYLCGRPMPHRKNSPLGRETGICPIKWENDWPYIKGGGVNPPEEFTIDSDAIKHTIHSFHFDFSKLTKLPAELMSLRRTIGEDWCSLTANPGYLRMYGQESPSSRFHQSLLGARVRDYEFECKTSLTFDPDNYHHMAGLMLRYDENTYFYLFITRHDNGNKVLSFMVMDAGKFSYRNELITLEEDTIVNLKVIVKNYKVYFEYSVDETEWKRLDIEEEFYKVSDEYATPVGYTGSFVAIAVNDLDGYKRHADFRYLEYRALE
ncbi:MAG: glycoside hydrolase family 43 protein [Lachnospiraceae bacterium]|nr:glycoside hydrolase family 43 protein [Lachnospiraceae bacterium]